MILDLGAMALAFALIFPSEFPDKTFIATLVLSTRYRHLWVWIGAVVAFLAMSGVAPTLRITSLLVAEFTGRAVSDRPKALE